MRLSNHAGSVVLASLLCLGPASARTLQSPSRDNVGPYNATFLEGSIGVSRPLLATNTVPGANAPWSLTGWLRPALQGRGSVVLASIGAPEHTSSRVLLVHEGRLELRVGGETLTASRAVLADAWQFLAATFDGQTARLYLDGHLVGYRSMSMPATDFLLALAPNGPFAAVAAVAPGKDSASGGNFSPGEVMRHFGGSLSQFQLQPEALSDEVVQQLAGQRPDFSLVVFDNVGVGWPWQEKNWRGLLRPQDPWTLPKAKTPASQPVAVEGVTGPALRVSGDQVWTLATWRLSAAPMVVTSGAQISLPAFDDSRWYQAVVPGTVLTTLIARGVYPDPTHGLNNMAIPESLARQDYWYRTTFERPAVSRGQHFSLTFKGINYSAEVWLNGVRLGLIRGAFARGVFEITDRLQTSGPNVLAVRISPPPHPGIAHEESIVAGPGENGGNLAIDGPTFVAAEGWDWIPAIRDRNCGIWQDVELKASGELRLLDPQVITRLPLPKTAPAEVSIAVQVQNYNATATAATIEARFEGVSVRKSTVLAPGVSQVELTPAEFPQLRVHSPRLWWPNGYGPAELYDLSLSVSEGSQPSDAQSLRFGIRHLTYELSLFDHAGRLRRVEVDPTTGSARAERLVDVRHEAIKLTPNGWAESLTTAGETSPAVRSIATESLAPHLTIRVNGVPIAARGGNWGTDDLLKRVARERLEPYFRLHQAAHLNIIRNWLGQNTEEVFYDLADQYGLLVLNDFWESTQNFQMEPEDPQLFLANAREVLLRYRNHPSIAIWFGRNEGVPQPILNAGLADLVAELDGTRHYTPSSNSVNLQDSGPYDYRPPVQYFTQLARGFAVEVGTPSLSTLESLEAMIPPADRWPISDTLAYHDWHFGGNGDVASFMDALERQFGAPTSLADFDRKAQMMNYVSYRAIFEGFQAHLWTHNSGRLLWMTHPAWPSNSWQIYGADYDTNAAYYGVMAACEALHAQLNLPDYSLAVVNTTQQERRNLKLTAQVVSLDGQVLFSRSEWITAAANATTTRPPIDLAEALARERLVLVRLSVADSRGAQLSQNTYWEARDDDSQREALNALSPRALGLIARATPQGKDTVISVELENRGDQAALAAKLTATDASGNRVLPVFYSDNYLTLLPGEHREIQIRCPAAGAACSQVRVRGWNVESATATVEPGP